MNKGLVFLIVAAIVGFAGFRMYKDWTDHRGISMPVKHWVVFTPQSKKFKISFPLAPKYVDDVVQIPNSDKKRGHQIYATEELDGSVYMLSVITYPADYDTSNKKELLNNLVDELLKQHDIKEIQSRTKGTWEGKDFQELSLTNKGIDVRGRAIMGDDKTIYVLLYTGLPSNFSIDEYNYFVNSFHLLPENPQVSNESDKLKELSTKH